MKIAYLVLTHKEPQVLRRTIARLSSDDCGFFVHIDLKTNIEEFSCIQGDNVFFSNERIPVYWGEFSQMEAILSLMRQALEQPQGYEYLVLHSGSGYPLRSQQYIGAFLEENRTCEFISVVKIPAPGKPLSRITTLRYPSHKPVRRFAFRAIAKLGLAQRDFRRHLGGLEPYSGYGGWALSRDACEYLLRFIETDRRVENYFRNVFAPDESFLHTILGNSPIRQRIRRSLVWEDWSVSGPHPAMISDKHVAMFEKQEKVWIDDMYGAGEALFARKFTDKRPDLLDRIDAMIRRKEGEAAASLAGRRG